MVDEVKFLDHEMRDVKRERAFYVVCAVASVVLGLSTALKGADFVAPEGGGHAETLFEVGGAFIAVLSAWPAKAFFGYARKINAIAYLKDKHYTHCLSDEKSDDACKKVNDIIEKRILKE